AVVTRRLQHEVAPGPVHPVQHLQMGTALDALQAGGVARIDLDRAHRIGLAGVLRALLPAGPGRADTADEIDARIRALRQRDGNLALPDAELFLRHDVLR